MFLFTLTKEKHMSVLQTRLGIVYALKTTEYREAIW